MNRLMIIGNLTRDPEVRTLTSGDTVCNFSVAVSRRKVNQDGSHDADFFRVAAWGQLGENCAKYLSKGRKVCVVGPVSARAYETQDHKAAASLEVLANEVEFLSSRDQGDGQSQTVPQSAAPTAVQTTQMPASQNPAPAAQPKQVGFQEVQIPDDELPF